MTPQLGGIEIIAKRESHSGTPQSATQESHTLRVGQDPRVRISKRWYYAFFTEAGLAALRVLAQDRRALDPVRFAHIRRELSLSAESDEGSEG
jgi:hypothetical protein